MLGLYIFVLSFSSQISCFHKPNYEYNPVCLTNCLTKAFWQQMPTTETLKYYNIGLQQTLKCYNRRLLQTLKCYRH